MRLCIIGHPISHSMSPTIYSRFFEAMNIDATYEAVDIDPNEFSTKIVSIIQHFDGFNVTIPFKERIVPHIVCQVEPPLLAVNCIFQGRGYNTDWIGFGKPLQRRPIEEPVMIIGAGGAARAVVFYLKRAGVKNIQIVNRTLSTAEKIKEEFEVSGNLEVNVFPLEAIREVAAKSKSIVNASSLGMNGEDTGITAQELSGKSLVYDLIYWKTPLIESSRRCEVKTVLDGRHMLLHQAMENLRIWGVPSGESFEKTFWEVMK